MTLAINLSAVANVSNSNRFLCVVNFVEYGNFPNEFANLGDPPISYTQTALGFPGAHES
jgi:hypothetical protein